MCPRDRDSLSDADAGSAEMCKSGNDPFLDKRPHTGEAADRRSRAPNMLVAINTHLLKLILFQKCPSFLESVVQSGVSYRRIL